MNFSKKNHEHFNTNKNSVSKTISEILTVLIFVMGMTSGYSQNSKGGKKMNPEKIMKFLDKDKDGKISLEEAKKARKKTFAENFTKLDKNDDGYVDLEELKAMKKKS